MPSPQSTNMRSLPTSTRRPGWLRSADGTLADVPRNVRSNIVDKNPLLSTSGDGPRFALHICVDGAAGPPSASFAGNGRLYELPDGLSAVIGQVRSRRSSLRIGPFPSRKRICRLVRGRPRARRPQRIGTRTIGGGLKPAGLAVEA